MSISVRTVPHRRLAPAELAQLGKLFDAEYSEEYGRWTPDAPYGYSPADFHTLVCDGSAMVAHVGFQIRAITVGNLPIVVAGTGGVLTDKSARGSGHGRAAMDGAQLAMRSHGDIDFGYLGCRKEIVPFYESVGWHRIHAIERHISRLDQTTAVFAENAPLLICPVGRRIEEWPSGDIDLRGTPW